MDNNKIQLFENKKIRTAWDAETEEWYFSVQDIVAVLTESVDVKQYVKRMLSRDRELKSNWGTICTLIEMQATDGKKRKIQAATMQGMFRIIQSIPSPKAEPFKIWMAEVAKERIDQVQNPELSIEVAMNKIQNLIAELCPNGVKFKTFGEVCEISRGMRVAENPESTVVAEYVTEYKRMGQYQSEAELKIFI